MKNAKAEACEVLYQPKSSKYSEAIRIYQGCPTIAVTKGGRIYLGWYSGGIGEPHMDNYNLVVYSDDQGITWSEPLLVIPSSYEKQIHALDIQLFIDPQGVLHVLWVQNNTRPAPEELPRVRKGQPLVSVDGYLFDDFGHSEWEVVCREPDAKQPEFGKPRYLYQGFLRCKPTFLENGDWLCFAYDQLTDRYGYSISQDQGQTFAHYYGAEKLDTYFDECMAYQMEDGRVRMFARSGLGVLAECVSGDNGRTWGPAVKSNIVAADTRFYVRRLSSGRILLIINEHPEVRCNLTLCLSEDDGRTWKYKKCIDTREQISYPDAEEYHGRIYLTYDRGRITHREILFASFTEQDIMDDREITIHIVSKPPVLPSREEVIRAVEEQKLIAILRGIPSERLLETAEALWQGGVRLLEITYSADGSIPDQEVAENIRRLAEHFGDRLMVGAGTVLTPEQVRLTRAAGGLFIISPNTDEKVIRATYRCGMVSMPGALTPTEVCQAHQYGADFVKLFPVANLGPDYVKAIKAPLSHVKLLAVGGVDEHNMAAYLKAGVSGFGIGSNIVNKKMILDGDFAQITALARKFTEVIKNG